MRTRPARDHDLRGPLFAPLFGAPADEATNADIRRRVVAASSVRTWEKGSSPLYEGDPGDFVLVLLTGRAKVVLEPEAGKEELILAIIEPFASIGELAPLDAAPRSATVITLEDSDLLRVPGAVFLDAIRAQPALGIHLIRHLSQIVRSSNERLRTISMYEADGQTVRALYLFSHHREHASGDIVLTGVPPIHQIAQMLGRRRETISTAIGELDKAKYLSTVREGNTLRQVTLTRKAINAYLKGLHPPVP